MSAPLHIYVATPTKDWTVSNAYVDALRGLEAELARRGHTMTERRLNGGPILLARNLLATRALRSPMTHLFFHDSDIAYVPREMVDAMEEDVPLVGGVYPLRVHTWDRVKQGVEAGLPAQAAAARLPFKGLVGAPRYGGKSGALLACDSIPNGAMIIRRDVLEGMLAPAARERTGLRVVIHDQERVATFFDRSFEPAHAEMVLRETETHSELAAVPADALDLCVSEDRTFCLRWRALGGTVWCDPRLHFGHVGPCDFGAPSVAEMLAFQASRSGR